MTHSIDASCVELRLALRALLFSLVVVCLAPAPAAATARRTSIVIAVEKARPSVVNIHGRKTVREDEDLSGTRQVNGMGTGIVIDERGYIVTNFHVVDGVRRIQVSTHSGRTVVARLIAHDSATDLAIIKIDAPEPLPVIKFGTSSDLMVGEPVIAIGNAYGYEHTITRGIISALRRTVQVSDDQQYDDLIQTDASINPGNSGGPLLNIEGDVIGINVAVRVGAQGIGFAVPIDQAIDVVARLMNSQVSKRTSHGIVGRTIVEPGHSEFVVSAVTANSAADEAGVRSGDIIAQAGEVAIQRRLDYERALLDHGPGEKVELKVRRGDEVVTLALKLDTPGQNRRPDLASRMWRDLGLKVAQVDPQVFRRLSTRYRGGMRVMAVRSDSPASKQGIRYGDVLVGMHKWETVSSDNIAYILDSEYFREQESIKFFILREGETLFGHFRLAGR